MPREQRGSEVPKSQPPGSQAPPHAGTVCSDSARWGTAVLKDPCVPHSTAAESGPRMGCRASGAHPLCPPARAHTAPPPPPQACRVGAGGGGSRQVRRLSGENHMAQPPGTSGRAQHSWDGCQAVPTSLRLQGAVRGESRPAPRWWVLGREHGFPQPWKVLKGRQGGRLGPPAAAEESTWPLTPGDKTLMPHRPVVKTAPRLPS